MPRARRRPILAVLGALLTLSAACSGGDGVPAAAPSTTATPPASTTTAVPSTTTTAPAPPATALDPELACLRTALADRPDLLDALLDGSVGDDDLVPALLVARDCLADDELVAVLAAGLRRSLSVEVSDFQATCLAEQVLALPRDELDALVGTGGGAARLAARVLRLCQVEG